MHICWDIAMVVAKFTCVSGSYAKQLNLQVPMCVHMHQLAVCSAVQPVPQPLKLRLLPLQ
jgi:hypothetical protein